MLAYISQKTVYGFVYYALWTTNRQAAGSIKVRNLLKFAFHFYFCINDYFPYEKERKLTHLLTSKIIWPLLNFLWSRINLIIEKHKLFWLIPFEGRILLEAFCLLCLKVVRLFFYQSRLEEFCIGRFLAEGITVRGLKSKQQRVVYFGRWGFG